MECFMQWVEQMLEERTDMQCFLLMEKNCEGNIAQLEDWAIIIFN